MISNESLFLIFNAIVGFFSDIILNIMAKHDIYKPISTLRPYFENKSTFQAALYALLTVVIIVGIIMILFNLIYDKYLPETINEYIVFIIITLCATFKHLIKINGKHFTVLILLLVFLLENILKFVLILWGCIVLFMMNYITVIDLVDI